MIKERPSIPTDGEGLFFRSGALFHESDEHWPFWFVRCEYHEGDVFRFRHVAVVQEKEGWSLDDAIMLYDENHDVVFVGVAEIDGELVVFGEREGHDRTEIPFEQWAKGCDVIETTWNR